MDVETIRHGKKAPISGDLVALYARHDPEQTRIKVEINDVFVDIAPCTTVTEALAQFHRKLRQKNLKDRYLAGHQRD